MLFVTIANSKEINNSKFCEKSFKNYITAKTAESNKGKILKKLSEKKSIYVHYRGCRSDTPWMQEVRNALCDNNKSKSGELDLGKINVPETMLFLFDGAGDFNASAGKRMGAVNLDGSEGKDLGIGGYGGGRLFEAVVNHKSCSSNTEIHYHSGSGFHKRENFSSALACAKEISEYLEVLKGLDHPVETKWITFGYSNGGALALEFQNELGDLGIPQDLVISIDPIVQALLYPFASTKNDINKRNENTKRLVNIFQNTDINSIPYLKLRGRPVSGADENILVSTEEGLSMNGTYDHAYFPQLYELAKKVDCEFNRVICQKENYKCREKEYFPYSPISTNCNNANQ